MREQSLAKGREGGGGGAGRGIRRRLQDVKLFSSSLIFPGSHFKPARRRLTCPTDSSSRNNMRGMRAFRAGNETLLWNLNKQTLLVGNMATFSPPFAICHNFWQQKEKYIESDLRSEIPVVPFLSFLLSVLFTLRCKIPHGGAKKKVPATGNTCAAAKRRLQLSSA